MHWGAAVAIVGVAGLIGLSLLGTATSTPADRLSLLVVGVLLAIAAWWLPGTRLTADREAGAFLLCLCLFLIQGVARTAGPAEGYELHLSMLPNDSFPLSWAARLAVMATVVALPAWKGAASGWLRGVFAAAIILVLLGAGSLFLLGRFLTVGATEQVDPAVLANLIIQLVEYTALALLAACIARSPGCRTWTLRLLPIAMVLLGFWLKHHQGGAA